MTLPSSGVLAISNIRTELSATGTLNLGNASTRSLAAVATGAISMSNFYGKAGVPSGALWMWGYNANGMLGDNTRVHKSSPVQTVAGGTNWKQAASGFTVSGGVKTDGTLWMWGENTVGCLGDNTRVHKSSPVQTVAGGTNWKQVSLGFGHVGAVKTDGTLWMWGGSGFGQLGDNTISTNRSSPVQTIAGGTNWKQIACGWYHSLAVKTDGTLWTWGQDNYGQLGDNSVSTKSSPVQTVAGGTMWSQVAAESGNSAAIKTDGTLWLWGSNSAGQVGDGTRVNKSSPVQTVAGGTNWKQVACGYNLTTAIKTDGTLWSWGLNSYGQLGDNTIASKSSPVQTVAGGTNWSQVAAGHWDIKSVKTDGTLWTWGCDTYGQLGISSVVHKSSPVQTVAGGTTWKSVSSGAFNSLAIK